MALKITLDKETRSACDLKKCGAYIYSMHPTTDVICLSYKIGNTKTKTLPLWPSRFSYGEFKAIAGKEHADFFKALEICEEQDRCEFLFSAHNAFFEQVIYQNVLVRRCGWPSLAIELWRCTAAKASAHALPRNLEGACNALDLPIKKDMDGRRLILKYCKPRKATKKDKNGDQSIVDQKNARGDFLWWEEPEDLKRIVQYCEQDVEAEFLLDERLPDLSPTEQRVWFLDQEINWTGVYTDQKMIDVCMNLIAEENARLQDESDSITGGFMFQSARQRNEVINFIRSEGYDLPDLRAKTVSDVLKKQEIQGDARKILEIRQAISRTSTAKFQAFKNRAHTDNRVRDLLVYHAASTGRWGGAGIQPQNFPRGTINDTDLAIEIILENDLEWLRMMYGDPLSAISSCIRGAITATPGKVLYAADYSSIETRVLFWMSNNEIGLKQYRANEDLYVAMAQAIFRDLNLTKKDKKQRQIGKAAVLGAGYGMGKDKFFLTCEMQGVEGVTKELSQLAIDTYRNKYPAVVSMWKNLDMAAKLAVSEKKKVTINKVTFYVADDFLWCVLPSGRKLAYYKPELRMKEMPWGGTAPVLHYWAVNSLTKKWNLESTYGGKWTENVVQAVSRDLMADAMLRMKQKNLKVLLSVHDEIVCEQTEDFMTLKEYEDLMRTIPSWANGLPVEVEGFKNFRYKK